MAQIDCSDMMGTKKTEQTWSCSADGSAECGEVEHDCLSCDEDGNVYGGTANSLANGQYEDGIAEASAPMGRVHQVLRQRLNRTVARVQTSFHYILIIYLCTQYILIKCVCQQNI